MTSEPEREPWPSRPQWPTHEDRNDAQSEHRLRRPFARFQDEKAEQNLSETAAPAPAPKNSSAAQYAHSRRLESQIGSSPNPQPRPTQETAEQREEHDVTELAAPAPVEPAIDSRGRWRKQIHLEDAHNDNDTNASSPSLREEKPASAEDFSPFATKLYTVSYLIFFSLWGTLARLGVQWLTFYPGAPVLVNNLWANFGGTFFMGFLSEDKQLFREEWGRNTFSASAHGKVKKTIPLFVGLATGFCGSFTSFSTFTKDLFFATANHLANPLYRPGEPGSPDTTYPRNGGYSFMATLAVAILTVTVSLSALKFGAHTALALDAITPTLPFRFVRRVLDPLMVFLAAGLWLGAVLMAALPPDRPGGPASKGTWAKETWRGQALFALVFSPPGALLRWYLALILNGVAPSFPLGTFAANVFGSAVQAMCYDLQRVPLQTTVSGLMGGGRVGCQVLQGIMDGFNGCLTTVSTWALELSTLKLRHAYVYGAASVVVGYAAVVTIMAPIRWTTGFGRAACDVEPS